MYFARTTTLAAAVGVCFVSTATAFVVGANSALQTPSLSCVGRTHAAAVTTTVQLQHATHAPRRRLGVRSLRAASDDVEEEGRFNPYNSFRKWQIELIESKAKGSDKYPEAVAGLMKEPGMTIQKAERLAKLSVSDPLLYAIERRRESSETNDTPMDYSKIGGFFPMEWIMSGDFGWGFNKKKKRLAEEEAEKAGKQ